MTYTDWSYECRTCGKLTTSLNQDGDCSTCAGMHRAVPIPPNAICGHCGENVWTYDDAIEYWCWDCGGLFPLGDSKPLREDS